VATTISRAEQETVALEAGADLVINRHQENVAEKVKAATDGKGVDRIVDVDLLRNFEIDMASLASNGVVSAYATEDPGALLSIPFRKTMLGSCVFRFVFFTSISDEAFRSATKDITACLASGAYRPRIALELPLDRIVDAHEAQETGRTVGKILIHLPGLGDMGRE
jgi:NADPH:quinone reductase-like Zn-dependent oxidoreductase